MKVNFCTGEMTRIRESLAKVENNLYPFACYTEIIDYGLPTVQVFLMIFCENYNSFWRAQPFPSYLPVIFFS